MKLLVRVMEARNLPAVSQNGYSDPYVKLKLGKQKYKTKVVRKCLNPCWVGEEFSFQVEHLTEVLVVSVLNEDKGLKNIGKVKVPVSRVFDADNKSLGTSWYALLPKNKKAKLKDCGEILLDLCFSSNNSLAENCNGYHTSVLKNHTDLSFEMPLRQLNGSSNLSSPVRVDETSTSKEEKLCVQKTLAGRIAQIFNRIPDSSAASTTSSKGSDSPELPEDAKAESIESRSKDLPSSVNFEEALRTMASKDQGNDIPGNLPGGVLLDQLYVIAPSELNSLLFSSDSRFSKAVADIQETTDYQAGPWICESSGERLKREITYIKAASKLIKAVKASEEQCYLKADGKVFTVLAIVSTPDVMYGGTFKIELQYCISPGPELPSGEQSSQLVISWRVNFLQSTMMKGMIENGVRQGLKEGFEQFSIFLSQNVKHVEPKDLGSEKEHALASLQPVPQSDLKLFMQYFANFTVISTTFIGFYVLVHIWLVTPSTIQGLEFSGIDLPDSIGEVIVCTILVLQGRRLLCLISQFMQARVQKGFGDHGFKARGDGWLLTVALIEGSNLAAVDSSGFSDPYVVFTCNGKSRTSSIKFQTRDPLWNEIFEFDAMSEPPSVLDIEVFDFDGPFDEAVSLGHAEINFLRANISDLADISVPLQGKLAQACQSKLHLRIFLNNTRGSSVVKEYLTKMEKEVGKKLSVRSPQTNSAFQKLFGLPAEEFLINDFTCHLKRKMPLQQGLLDFMLICLDRKQSSFPLGRHRRDSSHSSYFGINGQSNYCHDARPGRGSDARHGAKTQDEEGRLKFHFHSFVSFNVAHRTIMALWRARSLSPEQKVQMIQEESDAKSLQTEESESFLGIEDICMSEVYSSNLPVSTSLMMEVFNGSDSERRVMEKAGCLNYSSTPWELEKSDVYGRQIYYRFYKQVSRYGGEVTSTQQKPPFPTKRVGRSKRL